MRFSINGLPFDWPAPASISHGQIKRMSYGSGLADDEIHVTACVGVAVVCETLKPGEKLTLQDHMAITCMVKTDVLDAIIDIARLATAVAPGGVGGFLLGTAVTRMIAEGLLRSDIEAALEEPRSPSPEKNMATPIDWSVFDKYPDDTCFCRCGSEFRSHAKFATVAGSSGLVSRKPCPACGKADDIWMVSADSETYTL